MLAPEGEPEGRERQETKRSQVLTAISEQQPCLKPE